MTDDARTISWLADSSLLNLIKWFLVDMIVPGVSALQKFIRNGLVSKDDAVANRDEEGTVAGEY